MSEFKQNQQRIHPPYAVLGSDGLIKVEFTSCDGEPRPSDERVVRMIEHLKGRERIGMELRVGQAIYQIVISDPSVKDQGLGAKAVLKISPAGSLDL